MVGCVINAIKQRHVGCNCNVVCMYEIRWNKIHQLINTMQYVRHEERHISRFDKLVVILVRDRTVEGSLSLSHTLSLSLTLSLFVCLSFSTYLSLSTIQKQSDAQAKTRKLSQVLRLNLYPLLLTLSMSHTHSISSYLAPGYSWASAACVLIAEYDGIS